MQDASHLPALRCASTSLRSARRPPTCQRFSPRWARWEGSTTTEDLVNHVAGAIMMGFGGVAALKYQVWRLDRA